MAEHDNKKQEIEDINEKIKSIERNIVFKLDDKANVYFDGNVVSWNLTGGQHIDDSLKKDSTVGYILPGEYTFPTDYVEHVTVLKGLLHGYVEDKKNEETDFKDRRAKEYPPLQTIVADANKHLKLKVETNSVIYLCEYR